jgi:hypothetical protein
MAKAIFRRSVVALAAGAMLVSFVAVAILATSTSAGAAFTAHALAVAVPKPKRELSRAIPEAERADRDLERGVHTVTPGAVLYVPPSFQSADGSFDLLVHFHGNTELLEESVARAGLNALLCIVNLGIGSRRYVDAFASPGALDRLAERSAKLAGAHGLRKPQVRRVALSAWSAGFAGVGQILRNQPERVDAVLLMDGLHAPFESMKTRRPDQRALEPFFEFSERAAAGERLFVITHSQIETYTYSSTRETADAILGLNELTRNRVPAKPQIVNFDAARRATPSHHKDGLVPSTEAHRKGLQVHGYRGDRAEHHIAHLVQMSVTVLPPLVARWENPTAPN